MREPHLRFLANSEKFLQDLLRRVASVLVKKVDVVDAPVLETPTIVALLVESDHASHPQLAEYRDVVLGH